MSPHHEEYISLLDGTTSPTEFEKVQIPKAHSKTSATARWVTIILCGFVLLDVVVYSYIAKLLLSDDAPGEEIEIKNSYIGLDELYDPRWNLVKSSHHDPIVLLPRQVGAVFQSDPSRVSPFEEHLTLTPYGLMAIPDRHLQLSSDTRTIYQFRTIDYGMERCQLALRLPAVDDKTLLDPYTYRGDNGVALIDVCELDTSDMIDVPTLSWSNRPACRQHVGTFAARPDSEVTLSEFPCKRDSVLSYELSCAPQNTDCLIDVWSSQNQTWGIFMYQHQTI
ncbi:hypothetical protein BDW22DRAFT_1360395 [Trametopsis cervina]|nr:hypothetical protein BDW22DRAFT_1360395 [Trametopsis cervina]